MKQRSREDFKIILIERCKFLFAIGTTYAMDAAFLLLWVGIHKGLEAGIGWLEPKGYEEVFSYSLKVILELPTLVTLLVFIVWDTKKIIRRITQHVGRNVARAKPKNSHRAKLPVDKPV